MVSAPIRQRKQAMQVIPESPQKEKAPADDGRGSGVAAIALYFNDALLGHQKFPHGLSQQGFGFAMIAGLVLLSRSVGPDLSSPQHGPYVDDTHPDAVFFYK
jgi:hypothetical protein